MSPQPPNPNPSNGQTFTIPLTVTVQFGTPCLLPSPPALGPGAGLAESAPLAAAVSPARFDANYSNRRGFNPDFLGRDHRISLPRLSRELLNDATPLLLPSPQNTHILHYHNYSLVMHRKRRLAIYSAANVSFANRFQLSRSADVWRLDPRIPREAQIGEAYYANNRFDRGHLSRREDLEYGSTPAAALAAAADTNHFTNCTPQHAGFNQSKETWQGIERHILEDAILAGQFNAQVITGPVLDSDDPLYRGIQYPLRYWKVVAAINANGNLFAAAYLASQAEAIRSIGIEAAPQVPFLPLRLFQVGIAEIERITGLTFLCGRDGHRLSQHDPRNPSPARPS